MLPRLQSFNKPKTRFSFRGFTNQSKVLIVSGVTGIRKSKLTCKLCAAIGGELISADSVKVYRGFNLGSNKMALVNYAKELNVPLHMVDIIDAEEQISMGSWASKARELTKDIISRGKVPVIVGGTAYYINGFVSGIPDTPKRNLEIQKEIEQELQQDEGWDQSLKRLETIDPEYAKQLNSRDYLRLIRALEIYRVTGKRVSDCKPSQPLPYDVRVFCVAPTNRVELYRMLDYRCELMIDQGLIPEVVQIILKRNLDPKNPPRSFHAIGYGETLEFIFGECTEKNFGNYLLKFQANSRQFARYQLAWWRNSKIPTHIQWLGDIKNAYDDILDLFNLNKQDFLDTIKSDRWTTENKKQVAYEANYHETRVYIPKQQIFVPEELTINPKIEEQLKEANKAKLLFKLFQANL